MSGFMIGVLSFPIMLALLCLRIPIGVAMLLVGMAGYVIMSGWLPLINFLKSEPYSQFSGYSLSVIPLFLLMGQFATQAGMSRALFRAANVWLGHRRGGVAMAAVGGCAAFGAICGSSLATAATMAQVALPELRRYRYSGALATGTLAAGGTLGILIPPSIILVVYAILTEQNIAKLFIAAFVPGIIAALGYIAAIAVFVRIDPEAGPAGDRASGRERLASLAETWPVILIFLLVIGGIYAGWFTPTEGAAVGAFSTGAPRVRPRRHAAVRPDRMPQGHRRGDRHDLPDPARRRAVQRLPGAHPDADGGGRDDRRQRPVADAGDDGDPLALPRARLPHGQPVHDPAHHPDLLPDRHGPRLRPRTPRRPRSGSASSR